MVTALPVETLTRLFRDWPQPVADGLTARVDVPPALQELMAGHGSRRVRSAVAGHARLDPAIRNRLLSDPDWRVRLRVVSTRAQQPPLSEEALIRLMTALLDPPDDPLMTDDEVFEELFSADWKRVFVAARHPDPRVRRFATSYAWHDDLRPLLADPDPDVAAAAAAAIAEHQRIMEPIDLPKQHCHAFWWVLMRPLSRALAEQVAASDDLDAVESVAANTTTPPHVVALLSQHPHPRIRAVIAGRADLAAEHVAAMATDPAPAVRSVIATRAGLTAAQIVTLAADPDDVVRTAVATHAYLSEEERKILAGDAGLDTHQALRWAGADNPRLRRRAAQHPGLPVETVAALRTDPDPAVRTSLALHHPGAPGELLLRCYLDGRNRATLLALPQFPRSGLSRFADHPDPHVRLLAARDPGADPAVIGHLTTDPDPLVRKAMARCPRIPTDRLAACSTTLSWPPTPPPTRCSTGNP